MMTIKDLKNSMPQIGQVEWIGIRPQKRGGVVQIGHAEVLVESGLEGDHYVKQDGKRMITLIQKEHLQAVGNILGKVIEPQLCRRNIVVSGINIAALQDARFKLGEDVILEGTGFCHPCSRMEQNLGPGGYNAMRGHGGITAKVIYSGNIKVGDQISLYG